MKLSSNKQIGHGYGSLYIAYRL